MICPNCKKEINSDSKFCPECGYNFLKKEPIHPKNNRKFYFIGTLLFLLCVLWIYSPSNSSNSYSTNKSSSSIDMSDSTKSTKKAAPEAEGNTVSLKEPFKVDGVAEVTINDVEFMTDVKPTNPNSFYSHYQADEGKVYAKISTTVKNLSKERIDNNKIPKVTLFYDGGYSYNCFGVNDHRGDLDPFFTLDPLNAEHIQYLVEVPSEVKNDGKSVKVKVEISGKRFLCNVR